MRATVLDTENLNTRFSRNTEAQNEWTSLSVEVNHTMGVDHFVGFPERNSWSVRIVTTRGARTFLQGNRELSLLEVRSGMRYVVVLILMAASFDTTVRVCSRFGRKQSGLLKQTHIQDRSSHNRIIFTEEDRPSSEKSA